MPVSGRLVEGNFETDEALDFWSDDQQVKRSKVAISGTDCHALRLEFNDQYAETYRQIGDKDPIGGKCATVRVRFRGFTAQPLVLRADSYAENPSEPTTLILLQKAPTSDFAEAANSCRLPEPFQLEGIYVAPDQTKSGEWVELDYLELAIAECPPSAELCAPS
jgi:hypothetical protein